MTDMRVLEDSYLSNLLKSKKEVAIKLIFDKYFVVLCHYANVYVQIMQDSEDIVLDVLTRLWERTDEINIETSLKSYLFRAVKNKSLNYLRNSRQHIPIEIIGDLPDDFYDRIEVEELDNLIQEAILSLPPKCREVLSLSREKNMRNKEIAAQMGVSVKAVEAQITKALKLLKRILP